MIFRKFASAAAIASLLAASPAAAQSAAPRAPAPIEEASNLTDENGDLNWIVIGGAILAVVLLVFVLDVFEDDDDVESP